MSEIGEDVSCGGSKYGVPTHWAVCLICNKKVLTNCDACVSGNTIVHDHPAKSDYDGTPDIVDGVWALL